MASQQSQRPPNPPGHQIGRQRVVLSAPYGPDLTPIGQAYSKLKTLLRKENARSFDSVEAAVAAMMKTIK
jgi:hypothetical protein